MSATTAPAQGYAYVPTPAQVERARVTALMARAGTGTLAELRARSAAEPEWFWPLVIADLGLPFTVAPRAVVDASAGPEWARWFTGGQINVTAACVDRWAEDPATAAAPAVIAEAEDGSERRLTFAELGAEVDRAAAALRELGVRPGDAVAVLLPMIPEAVIAAYAIARIGALWVPLSGGEAAGAVAARLQDARCRVVVCADGTRRGGRVWRLKAVLDEALTGCPDVTTAIVVEHLGEDVALREGRDVSWTAVLRDADPRRGWDAEPTSSEHPFLLAYTSGTTGRPKGAIHVHGGFLAKVASEAAYSMDVGRGDRVLWVTDMGSIMGPWCTIGAHALGAAVVLLEAAPVHPAPSRLWRSAAARGVTHLGVSPALVRALCAAGDEHATGHDLSALRILGSTGEPWNPGPYGWLMRVTGHTRPIINMAGGTAVGVSLLAPYPNEELRPCSLGGPSLGVAADVFGEDGRPVRGAAGELVCTRPWPGMTRGIWGDPERYLETYWSRFPGVWRHGDRARVDDEGQWFLLGRSAEAITIAGRRLGAAEVESILIADPVVAEAAAVGVPDAPEGEALWCFWAPVDPAAADASERLAEVVAAHLGGSFRPARVIRVDALPKTRSATILRRALRAAALGEDGGDMSAAEDPAALERLREQLQAAGEAGELLV